MSRPVPGRDVGGSRVRYRRSYDETVSTRTSTLFVRPTRDATPSPPSLPPRRPSRFALRLVLQTTTKQHLAGSQLHCCLNYRRGTNRYNISYTNHAPSTDQNSLINFSVTHTHTQTRVPSQHQMNIFGKLSTTSSSNATIVLSCPVRSGPVRAQHRHLLVLPRSRCTAKKPS